MNRNHAILMPIQAVRFAAILLIVTWWADLASATALVNGGNQAGTILSNTTNFYTLTANGGDSIVLRLGTVGFDGYLSLYAPNGTVLKTAASGTDAELDYSITNSGTFTVQVSSYFAAGSGSYVLYLAQFPEAFIVPSGDQGGPLTNGGDFAGTNSLGGLGMWSLTANAGDNIVLRLGTVGYYGNLSLYGPNGALLKNVASSTDAELDYTATNGGTFTVLVDSYYSGGTGNYVLHLAQFPEAFIVPPEDEGGALTNGGNFPGTNSLGDLDLWSLTVNAGDNIVLRLGTVGYYGNLSLYGPNGAPLKNVASGYDAELDYKATNSGTFTALVDAYSSGGTGTYVLHLAQFPEAFIVPPGDEGGPLTNGGNFPGTNSLGDLDLWSLTANAGDNIVLRLGTVGYSGNLSLYGPNGALLKNVASSTDAELDYKATNSGTFTALVDAYSSGGTGTYVLHLAQFPEAFIVPAGDEGGPLTNGGVVPGTNSLGDLDLWSLTANAGDNIVLRLGTVGYDGNLSLYGPNGAQLKNVASGMDAELDYTATNNGTFTVLVDSYYSGGTGNYMLRLAQFPEPFIVPAGDQGGPMTGSANYFGSTSLGDLNMWEFTACLHDAIVLELKTTNFDGNLELYGENGALLKTAASGADAVLDYTATNCGTFTVLVDSYFSGGAGTYGLRVNGLAYELKLCPPIISGANLTVNGVGGTNDTGFHLYSTTNLAMPWGLWTPVLTNNFNQFGTFNYTNVYSPNPPRFFRFVLP